MTHGNCILCGGLRGRYQLNDNRCGECVRETNLIQQMRLTRPKKKAVSKIRPGSVVRHGKLGEGKVIGQWRDANVLDVVFGRQLHCCTRKYLKLVK